MSKQAIDRSIKLLHLQRCSSKKKSSGLENQQNEAEFSQTEFSQTTARLAAGGTVADLIEDLLQGTSQEPLVEGGQRAEGKIQNPKSKIQNPKSQWYLGMDIGTTGISAVLLERVSGQLYPVYWDEAQTGHRRFRLPAVLSFVSPDGDDGSTHSLESSPEGDRRFTLAVPIANLTALFPASNQSSIANIPSIPLHSFKPSLKLGIPYLSTQSQQWQPVLQWSDRQHVPLLWIQQALQTLLATLKPTAPSTAATLTCGGLGLAAPEFSAAIDQLAGVILGYPSNWSDTYSFNLREAVLGAKLVEHPEQIFLIEDTIAALLSVLQEEEQKAEGRGQKVEGEDTRSPLPPSIPSPQTEVILQNADWQGNTVILNAGATVTELALVDLSPQLQELQYADFHLRSLPFAGNAIDQDIVCHLLYPLLQQAGAGATADRIDFSLDAVQLADLKLEQLVLPRLGELDLPNRYRLGQRLESRRSGQILLDAARCLKLAFQQQSRLTLQLGDRPLTILRQELGSRILLPYVQRLNRELNSLLQQTATPPEWVNQVICTGGTASIRAIGRWLHEKFPNATIIQDTYTQSMPQAIASMDHCLPSCSRIAYGLAALPLHSQVLDVTRHQHSDYFLLFTLLRSLPDRPVTLNEIMQILQQQGVDLQSEPSRSHLLALLEGHLPPGLIPTEQDAILFTEATLNNPDLKGLAALPLCQKQGDYYRPNPHQRNRLQQALQTILSHTHQTLDRPYRYAQLNKTHP